MRGMLSPSLMCADPLNVQQELTVLDDLGVDYIHLDFMDNHFVPNLTLSPELIKATKKVLRHMKRDIHIMAVEPQQYFDRMDIGKDDIVSVHYEACENLDEVLGEIRRRGASPFLAISPDTKPEVLLDFLDIIDGVTNLASIIDGAPTDPEEMERYIDSIRAAQNAGLLIGIAIEAIKILSEMLEEMKAGQVESEEEIEVGESEVELDMMM